jgi:hypothetical protein
VQRLRFYERAYLGAIKTTLEKYDSKFLCGGEYATNTSLHSLHIHTSTRDVERVFSLVDHLIETKSTRLRAALLLAYTACREAPDNSTWMVEHFNRHEVQLSILKCCVRSIHTSLVCALHR